MPKSIPKTGTILCVDDIEDNLRTVLGILDSHDVIPCTSGKQALEILNEEAIDLILLDIMMPEMNGFEVAQKVRKNPQFKDIPIIFLTAKNDEDSIEKAYDIGGHDYVTKPFLPRELKARVDFQLKFHFTIQKLEYIASHDIMTGIYNRRYFFEVVSNTFITDNKTELYILMIDIDHFKKINDQYGHAVGDEALKHITRVVSEELDETMVFARLGGEEFVIALQNNDANQVNQLAERIRLKVQNEPVISESVVFYCSLSMGISKNDGSYDNLDNLMIAADEALYTAKSSGRNQTIFRSSN
jgi:diguanylate cyclase (GGDEF)-like protein